MWFREASSATMRDVRRLLPCVASRLWLLSDKTAESQEKSIRKQNHLHFLFAWYGERKVRRRARSSWQSGFMFGALGEGPQ